MQLPLAYHTVHCIPLLRASVSEHTLVSQIIFHIYNIYNYVYIYLLYVFYQKETTTSNIEIFGCF